MTNNFVESLKRESNFTTTDNGAVCLKSTNDSLVDLFGSIGALRNRSEDEIVNLFSKAFSEDKLLATKMSFYARNVRGGLGERKIPRIIWRFLANNYPEIIRKNISYIVEFGRWDDMWIFIDTPVEEYMWNFVHNQFIRDLSDMKSNKPISLLAKWLKSVNTSSKESVKIGRKTARKFGMSYDEYRRTLSKMRRYIDVTEVKMSNKKWEEIKYSSVPSKAMNMYRNAFRKNDSKRFEQYLQSVVKGEEKINSITLYPYDIVEKYLYGQGNIDTVLEEQWKSLPNFADTEDNILIMADVSGSMRGRPMATSVGLAVYFAERNRGVFKNLFMTFSEQPQLVQLKGSSLMEKVRNAIRSNWQMNTDIEAAFDLVLNTAVRNHVEPSDMPKSIVIISDMQFDSCTDCRRWSFYDSMKNRFETYGYNIPNIVFWNVNSGRDTFHATSDYKGVQIASGQSTSVFKAILSCIDLTPYAAMLNTLNESVYDCITV